jgi:glycopeptide antibiotics resistance protein
MRPPETDGRKWFSRIILLLYLVLLFYLTWFPGPFRRAGGPAGINLMPFATIRLYIGNPGAWVNIAGNLLAFIPLGFLWPFCFPRCARAWNILCAAVLLSLLVEIIQYLTGMGSLDVDDVLLNIFGGLLGWLLHRMCLRVYDSLP